MTPFAGNDAGNQDKQHMSNKTKTPSNGATAPEKTNYRTNQEVDAKIDNYIRENPDYWIYLQEMPRDRLERTVVLNEVRELERQHRIQEGTMKKINASPELKQAYDILMKDIPENQREGVIVQMERQQWRAKRSTTQTQSSREAVGNGV